jgi:hypothetical protein
VQRLGGQVRLASGGMGGLVVAGWDMTAVLAMGEAMGLPRELVVEMIPEIEAAMVRKLAEARGNG